MWKSNRSRAEQQFAAGQKKDETTIKQKEKTQREREERMTRLRDLRLAKEAADQAATSQPAPSQSQAAAAPEADTGAEATTATADSTEEASSRLPKVHPHQS